MYNILIYVISGLFAIIGVIDVVAYLPTIKDLIKKMPSANIKSYAIWSISGFIGLLYAAIVLQDLLFTLVEILHFGLCFIIYILAIRNKKLQQKKVLKS
jgi:hypothetical protein